jgi:hypothetical protein
VKTFAISENDAAGSVELRLCNKSSLLYTLKARDRYDCLWPRRINVSIIVELFSHFLIFHLKE